MFPRSPRTVVHLLTIIILIAADSLIPDNANAKVSPPQPKSWQAYAEP